MLPKLKQKSKFDLDASGGPVAVIDIGATSLRMAIAQINPNGEFETLDTLSQAVSLGKDSFIKGEIEHRTIEDCVRVLKLYQHKLEEYKIEDSRRIRIVATSAVREAKNRLAFLDRIFIATGFEVEPFDDAELHRVTFLSVEPLLKNATCLHGDQKVVCEVGGGSTEILVLSGTDVTYSQTYRLGSLRLQKTLEALNAPQVKVREIMEQQIDQTVQQLCKVLSKSTSIDMIGMGSDLRFAVNEALPEWNRSELAHLPVLVFQELTDQILELTPDQICQRYHMSYPDAETLGPAMLVNLHIARAVRTDTILVANSTLRDGLLNEMTHRGVTSDKFQDQVVRFALDLGKRYAFDEAHAIHVANLTRKLFDDLQEEHSLETRHRVILYVAAILHEIGQYVSNRSYHKHTMYLIQNSQFFGFSNRDLLQMSLVARYHRRAHPQPSHTGYGDLRRKERVAVSKMAAILRIAIALDESRSQRLQDIEARMLPDRVFISVSNAVDISLEQVALRQYGTLFQEVFGKHVVIGHARH